MTLFPGISSRVIDTDRIAVGILERQADDPAAPPHKTVVLVHGNASSALFWMPTMLGLPADLRVIAIDLRGYGQSEHAPLDGTRGVRDFSDDVRATLVALGIPTAHLVGWSMGAGVILQYALDHPVISLTLESPISPYGFGGTRRDGSRLTDDDAGTGGGSGNPDFVQRLTDGDTGDEAQNSPRSVFRSGFVAAGYADEHEDVWVESMLSTSTAAGNYPGDSAPSENWPGFAAGTIGVLNTMTPGHFNVSGIVNLDVMPPILWVRGTADPIVSDTSFYDFGYLGQLGIVPGWPGEEVAPAQPMVTQTRDVLDAYADAGGRVTELAFEGVGHTPHLERAGEFEHALVAHIRAANAPATETIILRSAD